MPLSRHQYLDQMGIETFRRRDLQSPTIVPESAFGPVSTASYPLSASESNPWPALQNAVANCTACSLHCARTQTVFGTGNKNARLMVIGEAPGFYEDRQGEPFVGRAGKLLDAMLAAIGLDRQSVYIANILKCRPPENRDPTPEEVAKCTPFLARQIELIKPALLLAVGRVAAHWLLESKQPLTQLRQTVHRYGLLSTPLIITYHPAYLLRTPKDKAKAFLDLQFASRTLKQAIDHTKKT